MTSRITIFKEKDQLMMQREHLSKNPPGNAQQRKKYLKSGWQPNWVAAERPRPFEPSAFRLRLEEDWPVEEKPQENP